MKVQIGEQIINVPQGAEVRIIDAGTDVQSNETKENGIMDTTNNHSPELVEMINERWERNRCDFKTILCALYSRDVQSITDADSFPSWEDTPEYESGSRTGEWEGYFQMVVRELCNAWDSYAYNYLMHIADDRDLETIIDFTRGYKS